MTHSQDSQRTPLTTAVGILRVVVTTALSLALAVKLTPPGKPVENGLEVFFPGLVILLLGLPFAVIGVGLIRQGTKAVRLAVQVDIAAAALVASGYLMGGTAWVLIAALPFVVDAAVLLIFARRRT